MSAINLKSATQNLVKCEYGMLMTGFDQEDMIRTVYNLAQSIYAIANNLDTGSGTLTTDFLAKIGTPLNTASRRKIVKPTAERTTEGLDTSAQSEETAQIGIITVDGKPIIVDGKFITVE